MQKREFKPRSFFRRFHPDILNRLFGRLSLLDYMQLKKGEEEEQDPDQVFIAWKQVPTERRRTSDRELIQINDMCCDKGRGYLEKAAEVLYGADLEVLEEVRNMSNYDFAATIFLQSRDAFDRAYGEFNIEDFTFRVKRSGKNDRPPDVTPGKKRSVERRIQAFYKESGKGDRLCRVEDHEDDERFAIFVHHENKPRFEDQFEDGALVSSERKSVGEAMAVYHKATNILMIKARTRGLRDELIGLMGEYYFGDRHFFDNPFAKEFDLSILAEPDFDLPFDPGDGINAATVIEVAFYHPSQDVGLVRLQTPHGHVHAFRGLGLSLDEGSFTEVKIAVHPDGKDWRWKRHIHIKLPDWWNLSDVPRDRLLAKYVKRWGFMANEEERDAQDNLVDFGDLGELFRSRVAARYNDPKVAH